MSPLFINLFPAHSVCHNCKWKPLITFHTEKGTIKINTMNLPWWIERYFNIFFSFNTMHFVVGIYRWYCDINNK